VREYGKPSLGKLEVRVALNMVVQAVARQSLVWRIIDRNDVS